MVSQTPQVWIDCQVFEHGGKLSLVWDTADALFPKQMTDAMFTAFMQYLRVLSAEETDWGVFCSPAVPLDSIRKTTEELEHRQGGAGKGHSRQNRPGCQTGTG